MSKSARGSLSAPSVDPSAAIAAHVRFSQWLRSRGRSFDDVVAACALDPARVEQALAARDPGMALGWGRVDAPMTDEEIDAGLAQAAAEGRAWRCT